MTTILNYFEAKVTEDEKGEMIVTYNNKQVNRSFNNASEAIIYAIAICNKCSDREAVILGNITEAYLNSKYNSK